MALSLPIPTPFGEACSSSLGSAVPSGVGSWLARVSLDARQSFPRNTHILHGLKHVFARLVVSEFLHVPTLSRRRYHCHGAKRGALRHV